MSGNVFTIFVIDIIDPLSSWILMNIALTLLKLLFEETYQVKNLLIPACPFVIKTILLFSVVKKI